MPEKSEWLGIPEVAGEYGIPEATLYGWRHRGVGPSSVRLGRRVKYRRGDIEQWICDQEVAERSRRVPARS